MKLTGKTVLGVLLCLCGPLAAAAADLGSIGEFSDRVLERAMKTLKRELAADSALNSVSGVVTHASEGYFFLQRGNEAIKVIDIRGIAPRAGELLSVGGAASLEGGRVVFLASSAARHGTAALPEPREIDEDDLVFVPDGKKGRDREVHGLRVQIEGRAVGITDSGFALDVGSFPVTVYTENYPSFIDACGSTHPKVLVSGVIEKLLDQSVLLDRNLAVLGVKLHVSSADDIVLRPDAQYLLNVGDRRMRIAVVSAFVSLALLIVLLLCLSVRQARRRLRTKTLMDERKRMADDLHDTIEQHLVGADMLLQLSKTHEALEILHRAKREMRDIVWGLKNDDMMRLTPAQMISEYAKEENRKGLYRIEARVPGLPQHLDAAEMRDLSLIIREAVGNAVKHGGAKKIAISCDALENGGWILKLGNDGKPFDPAKAPGVEQGHFGVEGMKARARRLGAVLSFVPRGERVIIVLERKK